MNSLMSSSTSASTFNRQALQDNRTYAAIAQFAGIKGDLDPAMVSDSFLSSLHLENYDRSKEYVFENLNFNMLPGQELGIPGNVTLKACTVRGEGTLIFFKGDVTALDRNASAQAEGDGAIAIAMNGATAIANAKGARSIAYGDGSVSVASAPGAIAEAHDVGATATATVAGSEAHALGYSSVATATTTGARAFSLGEGTEASASNGGRAFSDLAPIDAPPLAYLDGAPKRPGSLAGTFGHRYIGNADL